MKFTAALALLPAALAQQAGTQQEETHPSITTSTCTASGCTTASKNIVIDANWRWLDDDGENCYKGNEWNSTICPDTTTCSENCAVEGASYEETYGIVTSEDAISLTLVTEGPYSRNVGGRTYLMNSEEKYEMFMLKNHEFAFDVDVSGLPCGLNGALYFVAMDEDGGMSKYDTNNAGAKYGTGYCDAQCPHDLKFINGEANLEDWTPSSSDPNSGTGKYGTCCPEMDIWEGNKMSHAYTPHTCDVSEQTRCSGTDCGDNESGDRYNGVCDKDGCDFAPFRLGDETFYGEGSSFDVDTSKPFTVVTQFITDDNTDDGDLVEIRRVFVQDGKVIGNPMVTVNGSQFDSVTDEFCTAAKNDFGDDMGFQKHGGLKSMGESMENGMVLVMSLWDDYYASMLWLDSDYPTDVDPSSPGVHRGTCDAASGDPTYVEENYPNATVVYSNIKFGTIGSTYDGGDADDEVTPSGNHCSEDNDCNVCFSCCKDYLSDQDACDACASEEC